MCLVVRRISRQSRFLLSFRDILWLRIIQIVTHVFDTRLELGAKEIASNQNQFVFINQFVQAFIVAVALRSKAIKCCAIRIQSQRVKTIIFDVRIGNRTHVAVTLDSSDQSISYCGCSYTKNAYLFLPEP